MKPQGREGPEHRAPSSSLGVLGGMGPEAAVEFCKRLVRLTPARSDQDHIPTILINDPSIPDRTKAIMADGPSPLPRLIEAGRLLSNLGAALIAIPCNTAHYWYEELIRELDVPVLNIIQVTVEQLKKLSGKQPVGLLASDGTLASKLYQKCLDVEGIQYITPDSDDQRQVMEVIYYIKEQGVDTALKARLCAIAERLVDAGAKAVLTGCTELPLALDPAVESFPVPVADSLSALAEAALDHMRPGWRSKNRT